MPITKISGSLMKKMVTNGAINLKNNYKEIDALNVFPVPDGDTGTNMQMTIMAGVREIDSMSVKQMSVLLKNLSRGLLMGARGNSGVILSQFFRGIYDTLKDIDRDYITVKEFANSLIGGYKMAYKAVMNPVEGTILTVVREAACKVEEKFKEINCLEELFEIYNDEANLALANTPKLLPVLAEAGVVDSGGAGFIKIIEGMILATQGIILSVGDDKESKKNAIANQNKSQDLKFGFCTEFIVDLFDASKFDELELKDILNEMGDSLVVVQDDNLLKVHVHVNKPGDVLNIAQQYGDIVTTKIENMRIQHSNFIEEPKPREHKKYGIIAVCFGDGIKQSFTDLGVDYIIDGGQTMNPSTEQFIKAVEAVNADNIIIIPNNSNVILAAEQAASLLTESNIKVLKAKTIAAGYASLIVFDPEVDLNENYDVMMSAIDTTVAGEVTYAVRNTELNGVKITSGDFMGISDKEIVISVPERIEAAKGLLDKIVNDEAEIVTIFYGKDVNDEEIHTVIRHLEDINSEIEIEVVDGKQDIYSYIIAVE